MISYLKQFSIVLRCRDVTLLTKVRIVKTVGFPLVMYECENWTIKIAEHWRIDAFKLWCWRRLLRVSWIADIKPVHPKGNQPRIFIRTDAEAEAVILWPPDAKNWLIGKDLDAGKDRSGEEKGAAEDEMVRQHHQLERHEFEQTLGDSKGQGSLVCCTP